VISIPGSQAIDITHVRATTCNPGRFFATAEAAEDWVAQHPDGTVLPVADAYPQLRPINSRLLEDDRLWQKRRKSRQVDTC
jgi:alkylmercury lyase